MLLPLFYHFTLWQLPRPPAISLPYADLSFDIKIQDTAGIFKRAPPPDHKNFTVGVLGAPRENTKPAKGFGGSRVAMESHSQN